MKQDLKEQEEDENKYYGNNMFHCKLVDDGYIVESFFRSGESHLDVLEGLKLFHWPRGRWKITSA